MKRPLLFFFVPVLACALLSGAEIPDIELYQNGLISETFGPYKKGDDVGDFEITLTASPLLRNKKISIKVLYYDYSFTNYLGVQEQIFTKVYTPRTIYVHSNIQKFMNNVGIGYLIQYYNYTDSILLLEYRIPLKASKQEDIVLNASIESFNVGYAFRLNKTKVELYDYDINCYNFTDYLFNDKYYRLDLSQFYFKTLYSDQMEYSDFQMSIINPGNNFPLLPKDKRGRINLNMKFNENDGEFHIDFEQKLFVEPQTLQMSTYGYLDFKLTRYFYLPRNHQASIDGTRFIFTLNGFGAIDNTISWEFRYTVGGNLIGECYDSDYCIGSGVIL